MGHEWWGQYSLLCYAGSVDWRASVDCKESGFRSVLNCHKTLFFMSIKVSERFALNRSLLTWSDDNFSPSVTNKGEAMWRENLHVWIYQKSIRLFFLAPFQFKGVTIQLRTNLMPLTCSTQFVIWIVIKTSHRQKLKKKDVAPIKLHNYTWILCSSF